MGFTDYTSTKQIHDYLLQVLSRTGGKKSDNCYLFHYSKFSAIHNMITGGYIWLSSPDSMNDSFEKEVINLSKKREKLYFNSFSQTEENIAMYKMYAPEPDGAMLCISYEDAKQIITELEKDSSGKSLAYIVRGKKETSETVEVDVFWAAVAYKGLHNDVIKCGGVINNNIKKPLTSPDLAGLVKLYGWQYENEVRLCATTDAQLVSGEKLAIKIPETIKNKLKIVLCPNFDKDENKKTDR